MLETSSEHFSILECLQEYSARAPDRLLSFRDFLLTSRFRELLRYSASLGSRRDELLEEMIRRLFPQAPTQLMKDE